MSTGAGKPDRGALAARPAQQPRSRPPSTSTCKLPTHLAVEANGRASIYLAALSSILIALAFVGGISGSVPRTMRSH